MITLTFILNINVINFDNLLFMSCDDNRTSLVMVVVKSSKLALCLSDGPSIVQFCLAIG